MEQPGVLVSLSRKKVVGSSPTITAIDLKLAVIKA